MMDLFSSAALCFCRRQQYFQISLRFSYLFIGESIQILMIVAEEKISQNGVPIAHGYSLILQCRLDDGVHQDLRRGRTVSEHFDTNLNNGRQ